MHRFMARRGGFLAPIRGYSRQKIPQRLVQRSFAPLPHRAKLSHEDDSMGPLASPNTDRNISMSPSKWSGIINPLIAQISRATRRLELR